MTHFFPPNRISTFCFNIQMFFGSDVYEIYSNFKYMIQESLGVWAVMKREVFFFYLFISWNFLVRYSPVWLLLSSSLSPLFYLFSDGEDTKWPTRVDVSLNQHEQHTVCMSVCTWLPNIQESGLDFWQTVNHDNCICNYIITTSILFWKKEIKIATMFLSDNLSSSLSTSIKIL